VSIVSIVELVWVLTGCYALTKDDICEVMETLLRTKEIVVANADIVWKAVRLFKMGKADFADCLIDISAKEAGCDYTVSFDRDAVKHCGMKIIS
jgi:predicted nucleic-acid-binding protein